MVEASLFLFFFFFNFVMNDKLVDRANQMMKLCDDQGNESGEVAERWLCHKSPGKKHIAFIVFVVNNKKEFALHKRIASKIGDNLIDSPVSHVLADENLEDAVHRCLLYEYGIRERLPVQNFGGFSYEKDYGDGTCENEYCLILLVEYSREITPNPKEMEGDIIFLPVKQAIAESRSNPEKFEIWFNLAAPIFEKSEKAKKYLE
jgi:isopentenyldiphosphate isomerase